MQFALFITTRRKAPEKRASPLPSSARRSDGRISKLFSATSRAGDAEDELNEARRMVVKHTNEGLDETPTGRVKQR